MISAKKRIASALLVSALQTLTLAQVAHATAHRVRLYRDKYGMAHLYAQREEDGFYGLGYAIAEDRLPQILAWYLAVRGELAATFGPTTPLPYQHTAASSSTNTSGSSTDAPSYFLVDAIATDRKALKYRFLQTARRNFSKLPPPFQKDLRAYIAGLQDYMRAHRSETPPWAPPLEPALPLAMFQLMVSEASPVCDARRNADAAAKNLPGAALTVEAPASSALASSNAWAVAGSRTLDGGVIFESDSHSPIETYGTLFYPYRIKAGDLDFMAFDPAGTVMFFFGHSPYFAWGTTEGPRYVADCYRVKTDPGSPRTFSFDGKPRHMTTVNYRIRVKGEADEHGTFEYTHHNGVLSPVEAREGDVAFVVSYASAERVGFTAAEYYRMAKARSRQEVKAALAQLDAYPANLVIGGADGTIMYIRGGRIPIRAPGLDVTRTIDGNTSLTAWRGIHSYSDALKLINPAQEYIGNCNVSPDMMYPASPLQPASYPNYFGFEPGFTNSRQKRLIELLESQSSLSVQTAMAIAMDERIPGVMAWSAALNRSLNDSPRWLAERPQELRQFLEDLAAFDGVFSKESTGALKYAELRRVLVKQHPTDVDALAAAIQAGPELRPPQQQILLSAAVEAHQQLASRYGWADLSWGDVHRVGRGGVDLPIGGARLVVGSDARTSASRPQSTLRQLNFRFDPTTRRERLFGGQRVPFLVHFAPNGVQSYAQTLFGVSDNPSSPHYSDQAQLASDKVLRPIPLSEEELKREHATEMSLSIRDH